MPESSNAWIEEDDVDEFVQPLEPTAQELMMLERSISFFVDPVLVWINMAPPHGDPSELPHCINVIEGVLSDLRRIELDLPAPFFQRLELALRNVLDILEAIQGDQETLFGGGGSSSLLDSTAQWIKDVNGRWNKDVDLRHLSLFLDNQLSHQEIAEHFGVSESTIKRRAKRYGLGRRDFMEITDEDLSAYIIRAVKLGSGQQGYRTLLVRLRNMGIKVPRDRVQRLCSSIHRHAVSSRWSKACVRRIYRVPWINALWHLDGHHKLICWKIVIHGCIDGHSRMITFLRASNNNRAETVRELFLLATQRFAWPSRVRADYGKENLGVKELMEQVRGQERGSFIQGPSTRNQRIERLWVDLQKWCTLVFKMIFTELENDGELDVDSPVQMWALHFSYLPIINLYLHIFQTNWNTHGIRTAPGSASPWKLWIQSRNRARRLGIDPMADPYVLLGENEPSLPRHAQAQFENYGLDDYGRRADGRISQSDPYVEVEPLLERADLTLREMLEDHTFQRWLEGQLPPVGMLEDDYGKERFRLCCRILADVLVNHVQQ